jgi:hypothetical protein
VPAVQQLGAPGRNVEADVEAIRVAMQAVHEGARVEVLNRAEADPVHPDTRR